MRGSRNFRQGEGDPGCSDKKKKALTTLFFFFSPQLILQKSNGQFQRNLSFFKVPEGVQHFPGGGSTFFQGVSNCLFPIETHITCDIPGGPDPLSSPLDPHLGFDTYRICETGFAARLLTIDVDEVSYQWPIQMGFAWTPFPRFYYPMKMK